MTTNTPPSTSKLKLHPEAQVIITGKRLSTEQVKLLINSNGEEELLTSCLISSWFDARDGYIGHIDSVFPGVTYEELQEVLKDLAKKYSFLDLGISIMSGPPGTFTKPLISFSIFKNTLKQTYLPHINHFPPKRIKKQKNNLSSSTP